MPEIFADDKPARLGADEFLRYHLQSFPELGENKEFVQDAIDDVYAMFSGVETLWSTSPREVWYDKTLLCFRLLTAWYITDLYPEYAVGVVGTGGMPIVKKKIGPIDITFDAMQGRGVDLLSTLKSNPFGVKAYGMITTAAKRFGLFGAARI